MNAFRDIDALLRVISREKDLVVRALQAPASEGKRCAGALDPGADSIFRQGSFTEAGTGEHPLKAEIFINLGPVYPGVCEIEIGKAVTGHRTIFGPGVYPAFALGRFCKARDSIVGVQIFANLATICGGVSSAVTLHKIFLSMNPFASFLVGPYGKAFSVMAEYQFLPTPENFTEFSEEMYEAYYNKMGMPAERMFQMNPGSQYKGSEILTVSKTEMEEILRAKLFVDDITLKNQSLKGASDEERLNYFMSQFTFLFPDQKSEKK